jgi:hypothetical protein
MNLEEFACYVMARTSTILDEIILIPVYIIVL